MPEAPDPAPFDWSALELAARAWMRESPRAREVVRLLVECLQRSLVEPPVRAEPTTPSPTPEAPPPAQPVLRAHEAAEMFREVLRPRLPAEGVTLPAGITEEVDLQLVARRARLKAEAFRWAMERRKRTKYGTWSREDVDAGYQALISKAKALPDCYLWMLAPDRWLPEDAGMEQTAAAFDNLALAIEVELSVPTGGAEDEDFRADMLSLIAECQSALRVALLDLSDPVEDRDQLAAFYWLKSTTRSRQVYVSRHMRVDDPAQPADWYERGRRLAAKQEVLAEAQRQTRERTQALSKLRYHARHIQDAEPGGESREDWKRVFDTADRLIALGVKASSKELRDLVLTIVDRVPEGLTPSPGWEQIDRHVDEFLALQETEQVEQRPTRQRSAEVEAAANVLRGRRVVLIGGHERPRSREALVRELELGELKWITSREHESLDAFEPDVTHSSTDVVILMIRWCSHSYGGVKKFCDEHGKLFVRLPGGYSPNQVAAQVLKQVGDRLQRRTTGG